MFRANRLIAIALLLGLLALLAIVAVGPFWYGGQLERQIKAERGQRLLLTDKLSKNLTLAKGLRKTNPQSTRDSLLLAGTVLGIAEANLQKRLVSLSRSHHLQTISMQVMPAKSTDKLVRISVRSHLKTTSQKGLRDFIHELETGTPLLFIDNLTIKTTSKKQDAHNELQPLLYDLGIEVSGYAKNIDKKQQ